MSTERIQWVVYVALMTVISGGVCDEMWDEDRCMEKIDECGNLFVDNNVVQSCQHYNQTIQCVDMYRDNGCLANSLSAVAWRNMTIKQFFCPDCIPGATLQECIDSFFLPAPSPSPEPPTNHSENCPILPFPPSPPLTPFGSPSLSPLPSPPECTLPDYQTNYRQHCSMFSLSHLRSFGDRSRPLQTCLLLGSSYLIKHESLSVAVNGAYMLGDVNVYTYITEVTVTLHSHNCFPHTVTYSATVDSLPQSSPGLSELAPLELTVVNETRATILAPWINTSIVIHRAEGYLSVTLQVPEPLSRVSDVTGLCSDGCPSNFEVEEETLKLPDFQCTQNKASTSLVCLALGLVMPPIGSLTYSHLCVYDFLQTHDLALLSLYQALSDSTHRLPDVTEIITTATPRVTTPTTSETTPTPKVTSIIVDTPTQDSDTLTQGGLISQTVRTARPLSHTLVCLLVATPLLLWLR